MFGFRYYGGKVYLAKKIIKFFPRHDVYIEPFGGGAAVLLNKRPSKIEYYNDLDQNIVNLFAVLREKKLFKELIEKAQWTEKSEYMANWVRQKLSEPFAIPDVDHALATWFVLNSVMGSRVNSRSPAIYSDSIAVMHERRIELLFRIRERFKKVTILNRDALDILSRSWSDKGGTLIYLDPPYIGDQEGYFYTFSIKDHERLLTLLSRKQRAFFVLSGFEHELYLDFAKRFGWHVERIERTMRFRGGEGVSTERETDTELLLMNFDPSQVEKHETD